MSLRPSRLRGRGAEVGLPTLLCNRKDLVALMRESPFLLHKRSAMDAHAAIRSYTCLLYTSRELWVRGKEFDSLVEVHDFLKSQLDLSLIHI